VQEVSQINLNYRIPFYAWSSTLTASHSRSDVATGVLPGGAFPDSVVTGAGRFSGLTWSYFLPNIGAYRHGLGLAIEDRFFISKIKGADIKIGDVRSRPITLRYDAGRRGTWWSGAVGLAYARNLAGGIDNDARAYAESRLVGTRPGPGLPRPEWDVLRANANAIVLLPGLWELRSIFEAQWADQALIVGERFGVGGFASVRGFEERAVTGDSGARLTLEIWTPPILPQLGNFRVLWFSDAGFIEQAETRPGELRSDTLISTGLGLRWAAAERLSLQLDYAQELEGTTQRGLGGYKTHFWITYRY
jgi:hemolysin activation/secretion protein